MGTQTKIQCINDFPAYYAFHSKGYGQGLPSPLNDPFASPGVSGLVEEGLGCSGPSFLSCFVLEALTLEPGLEQGVQT